MGGSLLWETWSHCFTWEYPSETLIILWNDTRETLEDICSAAQDRAVKGQEQILRMPKIS